VTTLTLETPRIGATLPSVRLRVAAEKGAGEDVTTEALLSGKRVVLFGLPGAFTPTCSAKHVPGYLASYDALKAKGIDMIACVSVNDAWVMAAWAREQGTFGKITMIADGNADFTRAMGLVLDATGSFMGVRSKRYAALVENNVLRSLDVEEPGKFEVSSAEAVLARL
jgi:glutaredoxin/glutathione-dependent peroxiredoxin